ncbi:MAG: nucleotidyl transferase AbiEii/AbiGii toxin family protein [Cyclobacteriaceae bacterium]|nr:nucleotidyl transferase AbiEii/AbiGii toxin family protein [Cyclobacteriaceae bacterium]
MIDSSTFTKEHVLKCAEQFTGVDKILLEKQIFALSLAQMLASSGLDFVFKGGTSLILLLETPLRLSIDVDIIVSPATQLEEFLDFVINNSIFKNIQESERNQTGKIPKRHYRFHYDSLFNQRFEEYILLDVLFEFPQYPSILTHSKKNGLLKYSTDNVSIIKTPTINSILGDKLTAYAPETTGIPFYKNGKQMNMEIVKQLFDIGVLFDSCDDLAEIKESFTKIALTELYYRDLPSHSPQDILADIFKTSKSLLDRDLSNQVFSELNKGIDRLRGYIIGRKFYIEQAIIAAGKAAYLSKLILTNSNHIDKYSSPDSNLDNYFVDGEFIKFNKLRKSNPEAFYYWYKAFNL